MSVSLFQSPGPCRRSRGWSRVVWVLLAACHLGRPSSDLPLAADAGAALSVGAVRVPYAEPALADALSAALAGALAQRGALGTGPAVDLVVELASDERVAVDPGGRQVHAVRLQVACQLTGAHPRRLVVAGQRSYTLSSDDALGASAQRALAYDLLAQELSQDAVDWLLYAPSTAPPHTPRPRDAGDDPGASDE